MVHEGCDAPHWHAFLALNKSILIMSKKKSVTFVGQTHSLIVLTLLMATLPLPATSQLSTGDPVVHSTITDGVDYRVYDRDGKTTTLSAIVDRAIGDEVLLVGEEHDDMVGHSFQTLLLIEVAERIGSDLGSGRSVILSLEMFERDVQYVVDEYLAGLITEAHFLRSSRPWEDYANRYRPLVENARELGLPVLAANAPRRYVNRVTNQGPESLEQLSGQARTYLPPLPYRGPSDRYRAQWDTVMAEAMRGIRSESDTTSFRTDPSAGDENESRGEEGPAVHELNPNMIHAQALWDASMGYSITEALVGHIGAFVLHMAGTFHVEKGTGIQEHILAYRPGTRVTTVVMKKVDDIEAWSDSEYAPLADYVVLTRKPQLSEGGS